MLSYFGSNLSLRRRNRDGQRTWHYSEVHQIAIEPTLCLPSSYLLSHDHLDVTGRGLYCESWWYFPFLCSFELVALLNLISGPCGWDFLGSFQQKQMTLPLKVSMCEFSYTHMCFTETKKLVDYFSYWLIQSGMQDLAMSKVKARIQFHSQHPSLLFDMNKMWFWVVGEGSPWLARGSDTYLSSSMIQAKN